MRFVRFDHLPGGRSIELHPRVTVLLGAPQEVLDALVGAVRAVVAGGTGPVDAEIEMHGRRFRPGDPALELHGVRGVDPTLDLAAPPRRRPVGSRPVVDMRSVEEVAVGESVAATTSEAQTASVTRHEDPTAHTRRVAADDLLRLRAELRSIEGERIVLRRRADEARSGLDSFATASLDAALGRLRAFDEQRSRGEAPSHGDGGDDGDDGDPDDLDPDGRPPVDRPRVSTAATLAARVDALRRSVEERRIRRELLEELVAGAEADVLAAQEAEAVDADPWPDEELVDALELVRDQIRGIDEAGGAGDRFGGRERLVGLRVEEAELLDRLGFETYTEYVLGAAAPPTTAEALRREDLTAQRARCEATLDHLRSELSAIEEDMQISAERDQVVHDAAQQLDVRADRLSRLTLVELSELLRSSVSARPAAERRGHDVAVVAERAVLREQVVESEERVRRHEDAAHELAAVRARERVLDDRESDLLARISNRERLIFVLDVDRAESAETPTPPPLSDPEPPPLRREAVVDVAAIGSSDREWRLLARYGEARSVPSVGPVPLVVSSLDSTSPDAAALLARISSMSELVQTIVVTDDPGVGRWADVLADAATVIRW